MSIFTHWKKLLYLIFAFGLIGLILLFSVNYAMLSSAKSKTYQEVSKIEAREVALVLGTSRSVNGRYENPFFSLRMKAAAELYHAGKVKHFLVSGDNSNHNYNEPRDMREKLVKLGVPASAITMDFAGLRTLDSVVRAKKIFQQQKITIISQGFHNPRALWIASACGIDAIAYDAEFPQWSNKKVIYREYLARLGAWVDLYILGTAPKYLGDQIDIQV